jgi:hypothetical protein
MTAINLLGSAGEPLGRLRAFATDLIEEAERTALDRGMSKRLCLPVVQLQLDEQTALMVVKPDKALIPGFGIFVGIFLFQLEELNHAAL